MFNRIISPSFSNSFFIFGARGTGKSTWLKQEFMPEKPHIYINLLEAEEEEKYGRDPGQLNLMASALGHRETWIIIDEVQKAPKLLDVVHQCIEDYNLRFVLTGSSARKLKRGHANLLAGRAFINHLFPLTHVELKESFTLESILHWGSLPKIFSLADGQDRIRYLKAYAQTYLKEEILIEQIIRKVEPFREFLEIAAQQNGEIVNYSNIARDIGVDTITVQSYYQILEDTLIGYRLPAYHRSLRKRQRQNPKFYFFDIGIARSLSGQIHQTPQPNTYGYGKLFEHFVILETLRLNAYFERDFRLSYLRTKDQAEIDLIVERPGRPTAFVEIKSTDKTDERDVRTLRAFAKDLGDRGEYFCLSRDPVEKRVGAVRLLNWQQGLVEIGLMDRFR